MSQVLCVGMAVVDFVFQLDEMPRAAEKYVASGASVVGGGGAANAAVAVSRLGGQAILAAQLGGDPIGDLIMDDLISEGVDVMNVTRTQGGHSSYSSVFLDADGERQIVNFRGQGLALDTSWFCNIGKIGAVLTDTRLVDAAVAALALAKERGVPGIVDGEAPIEPSILDAASHVAFSMQGLRSLTPDLAPPEALMMAAKKHKCWACVTDGAEGVWFTGPDGIEHSPAYSIQPIDTLGAGDVWHGAFALALAEGQSEPAAVHFASAAAAMKCMKLGGRAGAPTRAELDDFLKEKTP